MQMDSTCMQELEIRHVVIGLQPATSQKSLSWKDQC